MPRHHLAAAALATLTVTVSTVVAALVVALLVASAPPADAAECTVPTHADAALDQLADSGLPRALFDVPICVDPSIAPDRGRANYRSVRVVSGHVSQQIIEHELGHVLRYRHIDSTGQREYLDLLGKARWMDGTDTDEAFADDVTLVFGTSTRGFYPDITSAAEMGLASEFRALVLGAVRRSAATRFPDVPPSSAHYDTASDAARLGIVVGFTDGTFRPEDTVTRRQIHTMRQRVDGRAGDGRTVDASRGWVAVQLVGSLDRAVELGIFQGYADGSLRPERTISRAEAATVMIRYRTVR